MLAAPSSPTRRRRSSQFNQILGERIVLPLGRFGGLRWLVTFCVLILVLTLLPASGLGQSFNASISGTVTDPTGASVPDVDLTLTAVATGAVAKATTGPDGLFAFPNLQRGSYELKAAAKGFREFVQRGVELSINDSVRLDVKLELGAETQTVEVNAELRP